MRLLFLPLMIGIVTLACTGATAHLQVLDPPVYVCPTATPRLTDTPAPTSTPPWVLSTPSGWATLTPVPGCIWNGVVCANNTPFPGGMYSTPSLWLPGATATPRPTTTPYPTPTPFIIRPPQNFYLGDPVYTGGFVSAASVRLRLLTVQTLPSAAGNVAYWEVEIKNVGSAPYEVFPAAQMVVSSVMTELSEVQGAWGASRGAALEAGIPAGFEAVALSAGQARTFRLAAYIPDGTPHRFTFALDPTTRPTPPAPDGMPGSNLLTWVNAPNPTCSGELAEPPVLPTP